MSKLKVIALLSLVSFKAMGTDTEACKSALNTCIDLSKQQDTSITMLKQEVQALEDKLASQDDAPALPWWAYMSLGAVLGVTVYKVFPH